MNSHPLPATQYSVQRRFPGPDYVMSITVGNGGFPGKHIRSGSLRGMASALLSYRSKLVDDDPFL